MISLRNIITFGVIVNSKTKHEQVIELIEMGLNYDYIKPQLARDDELLFLNHGTVALSTSSILHANK